MTNDMDHCIVCGKGNIQIHEIFFGINRDKSIEDGCYIPLCIDHHTGKYGIHFDHSLDLLMKRKCEERWLVANNKSIDDFIERFGKNYL